MSSSNDYRVLLAAERTLLAWIRTSISLMAFGFVIERFGLFVNIIKKQEIGILHRNYSFYIGIFFILLAVLISFISTFQYKNIVKSLHTNEIPKGYNIWYIAIINWIEAILGIILIYYLYKGFNITQ